MIKAARREKASVYCEVARDVTHCATDPSLEIQLSRGYEAKEPPPKIDPDANACLARSRVLAFSAHIITQCLKGSKWHEEKLRRPNQAWPELRAALSHAVKYACPTARHGCH